MLSSRVWVRPKPTVARSHRIFIQAVSTVDPSFHTSSNKSSTTPGCRRPSWGIVSRMIWPAMRILMKPNVGLFGTSRTVIVHTVPSGCLTVIRGCVCHLSIQHCTNASASVRVGAESCAMEKTLGFYNDFGFQVSELFFELLHAVVVLLVFSFEV